MQKWEFSFEDDKNQPATRQFSYQIKCSLLEEVYFASKTDKISLDKVHRFPKRSNVT